MPKNILKIRCDIPTNFDGVQTGFEYHYDGLLLDMYVDASPESREKLAAHIRAAVIQAIAGYRDV